MYGNEKRSALIIYSAVFVALITVGGWISIPFIVPFTLQTLFVLLAASVMKKYAVIPAALYVLFGTLGLPLFHNGTAGIGILLGPTGGFLIWFILMAFTAGLFFSKKNLVCRYYRAGSRNACLLCLRGGLVYDLVRSFASGCPDHLCDPVYCRRYNKNHCCRAGDAPSSKK